jgi:hypothetical protein
VLDLITHKVLFQRVLIVRLTPALFVFHPPGRPKSFVRLCSPRRFSSVAFWKGSISRNFLEIQIIFESGTSLRGTVASIPNLFGRPSYFCKDEMTTINQHSTRSSGFSYTRAGRGWILINLIQADGLSVVYPVKNRCFNSKYTTLRVIVFSDDVNYVTYTSDSFFLHIRVKKYDLHIGRRFAVYLFRCLCECYPSYVYSVHEINSIINA